MRLLQLEKDGGYSLVEYEGSNIPPYAILSHTWGAPDGEVSYRDLQEGTGKDKIGHRKLAFCAKQTADDGLGFFWVDTCCIDKSNHVELAEAINSMFRWYRKSAKCYAYLSDVTNSNSDNNQTFQESRWFTRGWTLQELLAPRDVSFFSQDGVHLGKRSSPDMQMQISQICGISLRALQGAPLSDFSVKERMSWATGRKTTKEEDMVYSLLGIFGIYMPLIYGEGREHALKRLLKEIENAANDKSTVPDLNTAVQMVLAALSEKLEEAEEEAEEEDDDDGADDAAEASWEAVTKNWKRRYRCCNCGSDNHLEYGCDEVCGRCKSSSIHVH
jgi:hypothetical protein